MDFRLEIARAASFGDIAVVFSGLFGGVDYQQQFRAADQLKEACSVFASSEDMEQRYEAMLTLKSVHPLDRRHIYDLAGLDDSKVARAMDGSIVFSAIGEFLVERNAANGRAFLEDKGVISEQADAEYKENCLKMDQLWAKKTAEAEATLKKYDEEFECASDKFGISDLLKQESALMTGYEALAAAHSREMPGRDDQKAFELWMKKQREMYADWQTESKAITEKRRALCDQYLQPIAEERDRELAKQEEGYKKQIDPLKIANIEYKKNLGSAVLETLLSASPVSREEADAWARKQFVDKSTSSRLERKFGYDEETLRKDLAEFYRLTGGRLGAVSVSSKSGTRADAAHWNGKVRIASHFTKQTLFHELAHLLEREPKIVAMARTFRESRADTEKGVRRLSSITGNSAYKPDEVAYSDDFIDPYVGKVYPGNRSTEVMSMGLQMFATPETIVSLRQKDPQMFNLMVGFMASKPSARELEEKEKFSEAVGQVQGKKKSAEDFYKLLGKKAKGDFWKESGLIESVKPAYSYKKSPRTEVLYHRPGDTQGDGARVYSWTFKSRQGALDFAYLWLLLSRKGRLTAENAGEIGWDLFKSIQAKQIPDIMQNMDDPISFLEDLKEAA